MSHGKINYFYGHCQSLTNCQRVPMVSLDVSAGWNHTFRAASNIIRPWRMSNSWHFEASADVTNPSNPWAEVKWWENDGGKSGTKHLEINLEMVDVRFFQVVFGHGKNMKTFRIDAAESTHRGLSYFRRNMGCFHGISSPKSHNFAHQVYQVSRFTSTLLISSVSSLWSVKSQVSTSNHL